MKMGGGVGEKKGKCKEKREEARKERGSVEKLITGVGSGCVMGRGTAEGWVDKLKRRVDEETQVKRVWCAGTVLGGVREEKRAKLDRGYSPVGSVVRFMQRRLT